MAEYGQGVGQATGQGGGRPAGGMDVGGDAVAFVTSAVDQVSSLPPETLLLILVAILVGLVVLRRAF